MILYSSIIIVLLLIFSIYSICFGNKNILRILVFIEILFLNISFLFILISIVSNELTGSIFALILFTTCAVDSAIGLSIVVSYCKLLI